MNVIEILFGNENVDFEKKRRIKKMVGNFESIYYNDDFTCSLLRFKQFSSSAMLLDFHFYEFNRYPKIDYVALKKNS